MFIEKDSGARTLNINDLETLSEYIFDVVKTTSDLSLKGNEPLGEYYSWIATSLDSVELLSHFFSLSFDKNKCWFQILIAIRLTEGSLFRVKAYIGHNTVSLGW